MTLDDMIAVLEAAKEGKVIQVKGKLPTDSWCDRMQSDLRFNFANYIYRVKPEPREWWAYIYRNDSGGLVTSGLYESRAIAESKIGRPGHLGLECVHVREVLP